MDTGSFFDKWAGRVATVWTFVGPIVPGTLAAIVVGFASKSVAWISQFGMFGALCSALATFLAVSISFALFARAKLWRIESVNRQRIASGSSPFDPMEAIFQNKRIHISDLVNPYNQVVLGKKFINCELIGPANIIPMIGTGKFVGNNLDQCDSIEISDKAIPQNAIAFADCDFEKCRFFKITFFFQRKFKTDADKIISNMNWLTIADIPEVAGLLSLPKPKGKWPWKK